MPTGEAAPVYFSYGFEQPDDFEIELTDSQAGYPKGKLEKLFLQGFKVDDSCFNRSTVK